MIEKIKAALQIKEELREYGVIRVDGYDNGAQFVFEDFVKHFPDVKEWFIEDIPTHEAASPHVTVDGIDCFAWSSWEEINKLLIRAEIEKEAVQA